jgi:hypothetical protein
VQPKSQTQKSPPQSGAAPRHCVASDLSTAERKLVDDVATLSVAVHLVLQLGYFKAKRQFFVYGLTAVADDLEHILRRHFPARAVSEIKPLSKSTQRAILRLFDCSTTDPAMQARRRNLKSKRMVMAACTFAKPGMTISSWWKRGGI